MGAEIERGWMEQRRHERIATTLKISYRVLDDQERSASLDHPHYQQTTAEKLPQLAQKSHAYHAVTQDISEGGLSIMGERPFVDGVHVEVHLQLPQYNGPLKILAVVARASSFFELGKTVYSAGLKLVALNSDDMKRLGNFLLAEKLRRQATGK